MIKGQKIITQTTKLSIKAVCLHFVNLIEQLVTLDNQGLAGSSRKGGTVVDLKLSPSILNSTLFHLVGWVNGDSDNQGPAAVVRLVNRCTRFLLGTCMIVITLY